MFSELRLQQFGERSRMTFGFEPHANLHFIFSNLLTDGCAAAGHEILLTILQLRNNLIRDGMEFIA